LALNEEIGYDMKIKEKVEANGKKYVNGKWIDFKHFIELSNVDKDVAVDKTVVEKVNNLPNIEELNFAVDLEFNIVERKDFTNINVSIISDIDESDLDKENEDDCAIFISNGKLDSQREYIKNLVIPNTPESEIVA
jgi:hypothetical protein